MTAENDIRAARTAYNDAIANRDADALAAFLLPTYIVVTARNAIRHSREESRARWLEIFQTDVTFIRTTSSVTVNEPRTQAQELGEWSGGGMNGVYAAKWVWEEGRWLVQAELFTELD
ncbi:MAG TPA: DUF4440 domain-containing protein [Thermoanaerobaculia bacterium]|jgi:ketosteroid isomerase-like protein